MKRQAPDCDIGWATVPHRCDADMPVSRVCVFIPVGSSQIQSVAVAVIRSQKVGTDHPERDLILISMLDWKKSLENWYRGKKWQAIAITMIPSRERNDVQHWGCGTVRSVASIG